MFGPIRLLIIAKESGEIVINHGFREAERENLHMTPSCFHSRSINIFDRTKEYSILIDRGSEESRNQFGQDELIHIINPLLDSAIKEKEHNFFTWTLDNSSTLETAEATMEIPSETNNYEPFISQVISEHIGPLKFHGSREKYTEDFLLALDICRNITL